MGFAAVLRATTMAVASMRMVLWVNGELDVELAFFPVVGWLPLVLVGLVDPARVEVVGACVVVADEVGCVLGTRVLPLVTLAVALVCVPVVG